MSFVIGAFSTLNDPEFCRLILGERYIEMTLENIESGDPMKVYKEGGEFSSFLGITANNLMVALRVYGLGVLFSVGTIYIMIYNGIMVGAFQTFFYEHGLLRESFLTIWIHGTLEISAIIIAGAAGIILGKGLIIPGKHPRFQAFQITAIDSLKVFLGVIPIFIIAGFIEGFLTRYTETPELVKLMFVLACLALVIGYFIIYPWIISNRNGHEKKSRKIPLVKINHQIEVGRILSLSSVISNSLGVLMHYMGILITRTAVPTLIAIFVLYLFSRNTALQVFLVPYTSGSRLQFVAQFLTLEVSSIFPFLNAFIFSVVYVVITSQVLKHLNRIKDSLGYQMETFVISFFILSLLFYSGAWNIWLLLFNSFVFLPIIVLWQFMRIWENTDFVPSVNATLRIVKTRIIYIPIISFSCFVAFLLLFLFVDFTGLNFFLEFLNWNIPLVGDEKLVFEGMVFMFFSYLVMIVIYAFLSICMVQYYFTLNEIETGTYLNERVDRIGSTIFIQGIEKENE